MVESNMNKILDEIIEISDPLNAELTSFKDIISSSGFNKNSVKQIENNSSKIRKLTQKICDKGKHLFRYCYKKLKIEMNNSIISKSSLKIKKNKEKTHTIDQLTKKFKNHPNLLALKDSFQNKSSTPSLSKQNSIDAKSSNFLHLSKENSIDQKKIQLMVSINCYVCKKHSNTLHFFYDQLCFDCGLFNYKKRFQACDLTGKFAILTGGRIKIGYQISLILLRNNCNVYVTTRFPKDALLRYTKEQDFQQWKDRLRIYGLDFRNLTSIKNFCIDMQNTLPKLDILINNAAQTNRHHPLFYKNLEAIENSEISQDLKNNLNQKYLCAYPEMKMLSILNSSDNDNKTQTLNEKNDNLSNLCKTNDNMFQIHEIFSNENKINDNMVKIHETFSIENKINDNIVKIQDENHINSVKIQDESNNDDKILINSNYFQVNNNIIYGVC